VPRGTSLNQRVRRAAVFLWLILCLAGSLGVAGGSSVADGRIDARAVDMRGAADGVNRDSLRATVHFLSIEPGTGLSRTRFVFRERELGVVADSLAARLERYTGTTALRQPFTITRAFYSPESTYTAQNIAALVPGNGSIPGVILLTAHYDAIGMRQPQWAENWKTWPAPGADDNGTGVATVMEAARILSRYDLPFSLLFVLFSGEELDRLGSIYFVEHYDDLFDDWIIAVINADMIGYHHSNVPASGSISTNFDSGWLAEMIVDSTSVLEPSFPLRLYKPGPANSDHGSFWERSYPGVMLIEPLVAGGSIDNPYYHTLGDTLGNVDFDQVERMTRVIVGFVAGLGGGAPEIALLSSDLLLERGGYVTGRRTFPVGDTVTVCVRVRNAGSRVAPQGSACALRVLIENARGARSIYSGTIDPPAPLDTRQVRIPLILDGDFAGENVLAASIVVSGMADDQTNNAARERFAVEAEASVVLMHSFQPNPITGSFGSASFCVDLTGDAELNLELYNLEGQVVATAAPGERWGGPLHAGLNCVRCSQLLPGLVHLASGVYLYRLAVHEATGRRTNLVGRFAVEQ
jgi:hypothetical protein